MTNNLRPRLPHTQMNEMADVGKRKVHCVQKLSDCNFFDEIKIKMSSIIYELYECAMMEVKLLVGWTSFAAL